MADRSDHWNKIYDDRRETDMTWHEEDPSISRELVCRYLRPGGAFIDIGGGDSRLTEKLADQGLGPLTILDVSPLVLEAVRARLGARGENISLIEADLTVWKPDRRYQVWHDRAVFHFLTDREDRAAYVDAMSDGLDAGGIAIIGTFAEDGPEKCSGLPVVRYSSRDLARTIEEFAPGGFESIQTLRHSHVTPKGNRQSFQFSVFRKRD